MNDRFAKMLLDNWEYPIGDKTRLETLLRRCRVLMDFYGLTYNGDKFSCNARRVLPQYRAQVLTDIANVNSPQIKFEE